MVSPLQHTKLVIPGRQSNVLSRKRLLNLLDGMLDQKLVIVAAPAGYGKTTLLTDWAQRPDLAVCWFALDNLGQDLEGFFAHFVASIAERYPAFGQQSQALVQSGAALDPEKSAAIVANEIFNTIHEHFWISLDDFDMIEPINELNLFVNRFVRQSGENCHVIIATRQLPTLTDMRTLDAHSQ